MLVGGLAAVTWSRQVRDDTKIAAPLLDLDHALGGSVPVVGEFEDRHIIFAPAAAQRPQIGEKIAQLASEPVRCGRRAQLDVVADEVAEHGRDFARVLSPAM